LSDHDLAEYLKEWFDEHLFHFAVRNHDGFYQEVEDFDHNGRYACTIEGEFDVLKLADARRHRICWPHLPTRGGAKRNCWVAYSSVAARRARAAF
jgi:hypothetical protein